MKEINN